MDDEQLIAGLRAAFGLADDADNDAILTAAKKLLESRNSADPAHFVPIAMFQQTITELNKLRSGVSLHAAEASVDRAIRESRLLPFMKDWAVSLCQTNKAAFDDFLDGAGKPITEFMTSLTTSSGLNARGPEPSASLALNEVNKMLGHSADDIKKFGEGIA